jgi:hypothetical protein
MYNTDIIQINKGSSNTEIIIHRFYKERNHWYIDLPELIACGWKKDDLQIIKGGNKLLNVFAAGKEEIMLQMSKNPFKQASVIRLIKLCNENRGGGIYELIINRKKRVIRTFLWICDFALNIFGDIPESIYLNRVGL